MPPRTLMCFRAFMQPCAAHRRRWMWRTFFDSWASPSAMAPSHTMTMLPSPGFDAVSLSHVSDRARNPHVILNKKILRCNQSGLRIELLKVTILFTANLGDHRCLV